MARQTGVNGKGKRAIKHKADGSDQRPAAKSLRAAFDERAAPPKKQPGARSRVVDAFWASVSRDPAGWIVARAGYDELLSHAAKATREDLRRTLDWFEQAVNHHDRAAAEAVARYLSLMPLRLLASDFKRLSNLFDDHNVGMVWQLGPDFDASSIPLRVPRFGNEAGFGLIRAVPTLYERLAMLAPEMEDRVTHLAQEAQRHAILLTPALLAMAQPRAAKE